MEGIVDTLQWDRACEGAEINGSTSLVRARTMLQWDRACEGAEIDYKETPCGRVQDASMGPRL